MFEKYLDNTLIFNIFVIIGNQQPSFQYGKRFNDYPVREYWQLLGNGSYLYEKY
jgi:hypothetical protein